MHCLKNKVMTAEKISGSHWEAAQWTSASLQLRYWHVQKKQIHTSEFAKSPLLFSLSQFLTHTNTHRHTHTSTNITTVTHSESEGYPKPPVTQTNSKVSRAGSLSWNHQPWLSLPGTKSAEGCRDTWDEVTLAGSVYLSESGPGPTHTLDCRIQNTPNIVTISIVNPNIKPSNYFNDRLLFSHSWYGFNTVFDT